MPTFTSQNGWPAYALTDHFVRFTAGGRGWWAGNADVATVAQAWITWFDSNIERLVTPGDVFDDWSHAFRPVRDQIRGYSNHASATAWDLNATQHPRGVHKTFTPAEYTKMRDHLLTITDNNNRPVLRLGAFYKTGTVDDMHLEINADPTQVRQAADKIRVAARKREENMPLNDADKAYIGVAVEAALKHFYETSQVIPNKVLDKGAPQGANWTPAGQAAAADQKLDLHGRTLAALTAEQNDMKLVLNQILDLLKAQATEKDKS